MSAGGKGHDPRPMEVTREQFDQSHVRIFGEPKRARWIPPPLPGDMVGTVEGRVAPAYGMKGDGDE